MKLAKYILLSLYIIYLFSTSALAQPEKQKNIFLSPEFMQVKDNYNYGLAHTGLNLKLGFKYLKLDTNFRFETLHHLALGVAFKKGEALSLYIKPIDISYLRRIKFSNSLSLFTGGYFSANYLYQLYPRLQNGTMYWYSTYEIGPQVHFTLPYFKKGLQLGIAASLLALSSRPEYSSEQIYYSFKFSEFLNNPHSNMKLGSINKNNHIRIYLKFAKIKRTAVTYQFEYFYSAESIKYQYLTHSIFFEWKIGKKQKS